MTTFLLVAVISAVGGFVQAATGFGFAIICMTLWPLVIPVKFAAVTELVAAIAMTVGLAFKLRRHIQVRLLLVPFLAAGMTGALGVFLLVTSYETLVRRLFGVALLLISIYLIGSKYRRPDSGRPVAHPHIFGLASGILSGFLGGLFNIGGPPIVGYFSTVTKDKMSYSATLQAYFILNSLSILLMHAWMGNVTTQALQYVPGALLGVLAGTVLGYKIFKKISWQTMNLLIYAFMMVFGLILVINP